MRLTHPRLARARRIAFLATFFAVALYACAEVTSPGASIDGVRYARGLSFNPVFPPAFRAVSATSGGLVDFTSVRVVLSRANGKTALDSVVAFPEGTAAITLGLSVRLAADAPAKFARLML